MEVEKHIFEPVTGANISTLAQWLNVTHHVSPLLAKLERFRPSHINLEDWLMRLAWTRGASAYPQPPLSEAELNAAHGIQDEELAVALCHPNLSAQMLRIRMAAQLLSRPNLNLKRLERLGHMERVEPILGHISRCCSQVYPHHPVWEPLNRVFGKRQVPTGKLPHTTRFAFVTGMTRNGPGRITWLENGRA